MIKSMHFYMKLINVTAIVCVILYFNKTVNQWNLQAEVAELKYELALAELEAKQKSLSETQDAKEEEERSGFADGEYDGSAMGFGGDIVVHVSVESGQITDIQIVSAEVEDAVYMENAQTIIPRIIEAQSADVDTVSGATFSSAGIKEAVALALEKAVE